MVKVGVPVSLVRWGLRWTREAASQAWSLAGVAAVEVLHQGVEAGDFLGGF